MLTIAIALCAILNVQAKKITVSENFTTPADYENLQEAINAATINGAYAMGISDEYGSITKGKKANIMITKNIPSYNYLPYSFGENNIETVIINGKIF